MMLMMNMMNIGRPSTNAPWVQISQNLVFPHKTSCIYILHIIVNMKTIRKLIISFLKKSTVDDALNITDITYSADDSENPGLPLVSKNDDKCVTPKKWKNIKRVNIYLFLNIVKIAWANNIYLFRSRGLALHCVHFLCKRLTVSVQSVFTTIRSGCRKRSKIAQDLDDHYEWRHLINRMLYEITKIKITSTETCLDCGQRCNCWWPSTIRC